MTSPRPMFLLLVLDGFGCRDDAQWNAIAAADTPTFERLFRDSAHTRVEASGLFVGLPEGQMGNSEVGHLNIGAGRVVDQDIIRISKAVERGDLGGTETLREMFASLKQRGGALHLVGLLSEGGVHSLQQHLHGLIAAAIDYGFETRSAGRASIVVHAILDGRDTPPVSALANLRKLNDFIADKPQVALGTIVGRYYTMDRDKRWERTRRGYDLMTLGVGTKAEDPLACVERFYEDEITDEFMEPIAVVDANGSDVGRIESGDAVLFFNFRADRMRQIVTAFREEEFDGFDRAVRPEVDLVSIVRYHRDFDLPVVFPPPTVRNHLGEVIAAAGIRQLRIAETEKYAHVTFFFNGGSDDVSDGEDRILIPSPKVATYDKQPEMSVGPLAERVVEEIASGRYGFIVLNIANPDMVGHTGDMDAAVAAVEATDRAVGSILEALQSQGGVAIITADHGNCEMMFDPATGQPHTAHTSFPVPVILVDPDGRYGALKNGGTLANVAPTVLEILGLDKPAEMTAQSLLAEAPARTST